MSMDEAPETLDTGAEPEEELSDEREADETDESQDAEPEDEPEDEGQDEEPEPERPAKKYAGRFSSAEDMEKHLMSVERERNELKRMQAEQARPQRNASNSDEEWSNYAKQVYNAELAKVKRHFGEYMEDHQLEAIAADNTRDKLEMQLQFNQRLDAVSNNMAFQMDPRRQMHEQFAEASPTYREHMNNPVMRQAMSELINAISNQGQPRNARQSHVPHQKPRGGNAGGQKRGGPPVEDKADRRARRELSQSLGIPENKITAKGIKAYREGAGW